MFKFLEIYICAMRIFITKIIHKYILEYMVKIPTLQLKMPQVLCMNHLPTNDIIARSKKKSLERENAFFPFYKGDS